MKDPYQTLEVSQDASMEQIREQYRLLVQAWHPDKFRNPNQRAKAEERLKEINAAYEALTELARSWSGPPNAPNRQENSAAAAGGAEPDPEAHAEAYAAGPAGGTPPRPAWETGYSRPQATAAQWPAHPFYTRPGTWLWALAALLLAFMIPLAFSPSMQRWISNLIIGAPDQPARSVGGLPSFQPDLNTLPPRLATLTEAEAALKNAAPFLEELGSDSRIAAPGEQVYQVRDLRVNLVLVGWKLCASSQSTIDTYWPNLTYTLSVDRDTSGTEALYMIDFNSLVDTSSAGEQKARCRLLYTALQDWPIGAHEVVLEVRSRTPLDTGWEYLPNGVFSKRVYKVSVEHGLFRLPEQ